MSSLSVGSHTLTFSTVSGYTPPASQTLTVAANTTTPASGTYVAIAQTGSLQVTITPTGAVGAGAQWQVDSSIWQNSGTTFAGLSVGSHTVTFSTVSGYATPSSQSITVSANNTTPATGTYVAIPQTGSLQVTINPVGAVTAGAQWQVDGGSLQASGATVPSLSIGSHTVAFSTVGGYTAPASQTVTVAANTTTPATGTYLAISQTGSLQVTLLPLAAVNAGAQWQVDGGALQTSGVIISNLSAGNHTLAFKSISGWVAPSSQTVIINPNSTTPAAGRYLDASLISWLSRSSGTSNRLSAIADGNGTLVAVGSSGTILTSQDGVTWTVQTSGTSQDLNAVCYGNGTLVVGGAGGTLLTSTDAIHWTSRSSADTGNIYTLTYGNGLFVAAGLGAVIQTSPDGINWTSQGAYGGYNLYSAISGNGLFAVGGYNPTGVVVTSTNGVNWTPRSVGGIFHGLTYGNGLFVGVGDNSAIGTSSDGINWDCTELRYHEFTFCGDLRKCFYCCGTGRSNFILDGWR